MFVRRGFSLVELMIVVAIVGILSIVAAPNYKRYMSRSTGANIVAIVPQMESQWTAMYLRGDTSEVEAVPAGQIKYVSSIYLNPSAYTTPLVRVLLNSEAAVALGSWADELNLLYIPTIANGIASFKCKYEGPNAMTTSTEAEKVFKDCVSCAGAC